MPAGGKRVTATLDIQAQVTNYQESLKKLQGAISSLHLPDGLKKGFDNLFIDYQKELEKLSKNSANNKLSILNEKEIEKSFDKIEGYYSSLVKKLRSSNYKESILEADFQAIEKMKEAQVNYSKAVKDSKKELDKEQDALDKLKAKLQEQKKEQKSLGSSKGGATTAQKNAQKAVESTTKALQEQKIVSKEATDQYKAQQKVTSSAQKEYQRALNAQAAAEQKLADFRDKNKDKTDDKTKQRELDLIKAQETAIEKVKKAEQNLTAEKGKEAQLQQKANEEEAKREQLADKATEAKKREASATSSLNKATTEYEKKAQEITQTEEQISQQTKNVDEKRQAYEKLAKDTLTEVVNGLKKVAEAAGIDTSQIKSIEDVEKILEKLGDEAKDKAAPAINDTGESLQKAGDAGEAANKGFKEASIGLHELTEREKEVRRLSESVLRFFSIDNAVRLFKRAVRSAFETVQDLDKVMTETAVVTDFSVGDMWSQLPEYTKRANELGVSIHSVYEASTLYYQQGLKTNEVMAVTNATLRMARIASLDAAEATDRVTNALRGFNMEINESNADRIADVYSKLAAMSASNVDEISTAMTKVASLANSANMEFENTAAFLAQIIETTRESAETAGTALKTVVARFSEVKKLFTKGELTGSDEEGEIIDVNKVSAALRTAGIDLNEFLTGAKGLDEIFMELASKWDQLDIVQQRYIATMAAGSRQQSRFIALMSDYQRTQELTTAANNAAGASMEQYSKTTESLQNKIAKLKNAWDEFVTGIINSDFIKSAVDALTSLIGVINKLTKDSNTYAMSIKRIALAAAGLALGKKAFKGIIASIGATFLGAGKTAGETFGQGFLTSIDKVKSIFSVFTKNFWVGLGDTAPQFKVLQDSMSGLAAAEANLDAVRKSSVATEAEKLAAEEALAGAQLQNEAVLKALTIDENAYNLVKQSGLTVQEQAVLLNGSEASQKILNAMANEKLTAEEIREIMAKEGLNTVGKKGLLIRILEVAQLAAEKLGLKGVTAAIYQKTLAKKVENGVLEENIALQLISLGLITAIIAAIALLVIGIYALVKASHQISVAEQLENTETAVDSLKESLDETTQKTENLKSSLDSLKENYATIETLRQGTDKWKEKVEETNGKVLELLGTFQEASKYITFDPKTGMLTFDFEQAEEDDFLGEQYRKQETMESALDMMEARQKKLDVQGKIESLPRDLKFKTIGLAKGKGAGKRFVSTGSSNDIWNELINEYNNKGILNEADYQNFIQKQSEKHNRNFEFPTFEEILPTLQSLAQKTKQVEETEDKYIDAQEGRIAAIIASKKELEIDTEEENQILNYLSSSGFYEEERNKLNNRTFNIGTPEIVQLEEYTGYKYQDGALVDRKSGEVKIAEDQVQELYKDIVALQNTTKVVEDYYGELIEIEDKNLQIIAAKSLAGERLTEAEINYLNKLDLTETGPLGGRLGRARQAVIYEKGYSERENAKDVKFTREQLTSLGIKDLPENLTANILESLYTKVKEFDEGTLRRTNKLIGSIDEDQRADFIKDFIDLNLRDIDDIKKFSDVWGVSITQQVVNATKAAQNFDLTEIFNNVQEATKLANTYKGKDTVSNEDYQKIDEVTNGSLKDFFTQDQNTGNWIYTNIEVPIEQAIQEAAKKVANEKLELLDKQNLNQSRDNEILSKAGLEGYDTVELQKVSNELQKQNLLKEELNTKEVQYGELSRETALAVTAINTRLNSGLSKILESYEDWNKLIDENGQLRKKLSGDEVKVLSSLKESLKETLNIEGELSDTFLENNIEDIRALAKGGEEAEQALARLQKAASMDYLTKLKVDTSEVEGAEEEITSFENYVKSINIPKLEVGAKWTGESAQSFIKRFNDMAKAANLTTNQIREYMKRLGYDVEVTMEPLWQEEYLWVKNIDYEVEPGGGVKMVAKPGKTYKKVRSKVGEYPVVKTLTSAGSGGGGISYKNSAGAGGSSGGGSGGGGGSSKSEKAEEPKTWENPFDELYNLSEKINESIRLRNQLEKEYQVLLNDESTTYQGIRKNLFQQIDALKERARLVQERMTRRQKKIEDIGNVEYTDDEGNTSTLAALGVMDYVKYDPETQTMQIDYPKLEKLSGTPGSDKLGKAIEFTESLLKDWSSEYEEDQETLVDIYQEIEDLKNEAINQYRDFEDRVMEAIVAERQAEIDELQALSDTITDSTSRVIDGIREQVEAERQARQNEKAEEDIADKEARLAYLQRDTSGANDLEIMKLNEELENDRQNYTDSLIDQGIQKMQEQADKAQEQRQRQIDLMTAQLAIDQKTGELWPEAYDLINSAFNNDGSINEDSKLLTLLKKMEGFEGLSAFGKNLFEEAYNQGLLSAAAGLAAGGAKEAGQQINGDKETAKKVANTTPSKVSDEKLKAYNVTTKEEKPIQQKTQAQKQAEEVAAKKKAEEAAAKKAQEAAKQKAADDAKKKAEEAAAKQKAAAEAEKKKAEEAAATKRKYGVALAILNNATGSGWGSGDTRKKNLKNKGFDPTEIQNLVNELYKIDTKAIKPDGKATDANTYLKNKYGITSSTAYYMNKFASGGLADFTGLAWLDGTKSKPEIVLNPEDSQNLITLKDILSQLLRNPIQSGAQGAGGDNYYEINIDAEIANDYDVDRLASRIKQQIYSDSMYRNVNTLNWQR